MTADSERPQVVVGRISGVFGVRGQVKVFSYTEPRKNILNYDPWMLGSDDSWQAMKIESGQQHGKGIIARLEGCNDRDQALELVGKDIAICREQLPEVAADEFYWSDLEGLTVTTKDGVVLGVVSHLFETGSNDVLVVKGEGEHLIPYIWGQVVQEINLDTGIIEVDWDPEY